jgi:hypothetical protein
VGGAAGSAGAGGNGGAGGAVSCIRGLSSGYVVRTDGSLVYYIGSTVVLDQATGAPLVGVVALQDGDYEGAGCAALPDGTVKCWWTRTDRTNVGQIGNGLTSGTVTTFHATPVVVSGGAPLTGVHAMARGDYATASCALTTVGQVYCWGDLTWMVNNGTTLNTGFAQLLTTDGSTPLDGVVQLAAGNRQACALRAAGATNEVWCWGNASAYELGQGDTVNHQYPVKVGGLTNPSMLALAANNTSGGTINYALATVCALDGGKVLCWGGNASGSAGTKSSAASVMTPTPVVDQSGTAIDNVVDIESGYAGFSVLRSDGTMWRWGANANNYAANYGVTGVVAIGYGGDATFGPLFLTSDGTYRNRTTVVPVACPAQ